MSQNARGLSLSELREAAGLSPEEPTERAVCKACGQPSEHALHYGLCVWCYGATVQVDDKVMFDRDSF